MPKTSLIRQLYSLVFPVQCLSCSCEGDWICPSCQKQLPTSRPEQCVICGKAAKHGLCDKCRRRTKLDGAVSLFSYAEKPIQKLIKAAKYRSHTDALMFWSKTYRTRTLRRLPEIEFTFTAIPLAKDRLTQRGFNQSEILARLLAGNEYPITKLLKKVKATDSQTALDKKERQANIRGAFAPTRKVVGPDIVLVDDVITTGATLAEAAKTLRKAGAKTIWAMTIAHG